jgi:hypothetical protein
MAFEVSIEIGREFAVTCGMDRVFAVLADVPESASHFPKLDQLVDLGDGAYRWEMEKIGLASYSIQICYGCTYTSNKEEGWVDWKPVEGEGNARIEGYWNLEKADDSVHIEFYTSGVLSLSLPRLVRIVIAPLVVAEFNSLVDTYVENLKRIFGAAE